MNDTSSKRTKRRGRPFSPLITRETALRAAIDIVDREGLEALSLQGVARALGVTAPSLYYHFRDKQDLLGLLARELLNEVGGTETAGQGWEERAIGLAVATRRVILAHPNAAPLMLIFFPRRIMLGAYERTLRDCPYAPEHHMTILEAMESLTYGGALFAAAAETRHVAAMPAFEAGHYPHLAKAMAVTPKDDEAVFIETLNVLFDGFRTRFGKRD